jgi:hypothetical protein
MNLKSIPIAAMLLGCTLVAPGLLSSAHAQPGKDIPPSEAMEHEGDLAFLDKIAQRTTPTGAAARELIALLKDHMATEEDFILPPLTLLPELAAGKVSPDMRWALVDSDRLRAELASVRAMHGKLTVAFLNLKQAAQDEHDAAVEGFSSDLAADDLGDVDITEPTVLLIGDWLRAKLPPTQ